MTPKLQEIFDKGVAAALDRQLLLGDLLGEHEWTFSMENGRLGFKTAQGESFAFDAQVLGSESDQSESWLWSWANQDSGIPPALLKVAGSIKDWGQKEGVEELMTPKLPLEQAEGHCLAMACARLIDASFYYRGPYDGGAVFLMVKDPSFKTAPADPVARIGAVFPQLLSSGEFPEVRDQIKALSEYMIYYGMQVAPAGSGQEGTTLTGKLPDGRELRAEFDAAGRLTNLTGNAV